MDKSAPIRRNRKGEIEVDPTTKDTELVKLSEDVEDYMEREVVPYVPDAIWRDEETDKVVKTGAEIPFTKYFYRYSAPQPAAELLSEFERLESGIESLICDLILK